MRVEAEAAVSDPKLRQEMFEDSRTAESGTPLGDYYERLFEEIRLLEQAEPAAPAKHHGSDFTQAMRQGMDSMPDESRVAAQGALAR